MEQFSLIIGCGETDLDEQLLRCVVVGGEFVIDEVKTLFDGVYHKIGDTDLFSFSSVFEYFDSNLILMLLLFNCCC